MSESIRDLLVDNVEFSGGVAVVGAGIWPSLLELVEAAEVAERDLHPREFRTGSQQPGRLAQALAGVRIAARLQQAR